MSVIQTLIDRVKDPELRRRLLDEVERMNRRRKFGLVFEEHLPEATPLYDVSIKRGMLVARRTQGEFKEFYVVKDMDGERLICERYDESREQVELEKKEVVAVALFGQAIYPYLKPVDEIKNAPDTALWHTLIEAENYHALQLLSYLYGGKVDCIYIDPPYNTGAKDWKYNNNYVEDTDVYRHSKWLNMMKKRLKLAKKLLNPNDSVLIVTIDEKEFQRLGCLLEEVFSEAHIQMVSIVTNPNGVARDHEMYRVDEFAFFVYLGDAGPVMLDDPLFTSDFHQNQLIEASRKGVEAKKHKIRWERLLRGGSNSDRSHSPGCFYPVYIDPHKSKIVEIGDAILPSDSKDDVEGRDGLVMIWPISEGRQEEKVWQTTPANLRRLCDLGFAKVGAYNRKKDRWTLLYLGKKQRQRIDSGQIIITGRDENDVVHLEGAQTQSIKRYPKTIWNRQLHSAGEYGSRLIKTLLPGREFPFPKSIYAVRDTLKSILAHKPGALIVDFFAGSGTTLHAVNLLNAEDGGQRRCIMVTNNEVSAEEEKRLRAEGFQPTDKEWERLGIARYVCWPRSVCSIKGVDINGQPLTGSYHTCLTTEKEKPRRIKQVTLVADPKALTTLQKKELVALCCQGKLPQSLVKADSSYIVSEEHPCSILFDVAHAEEWLDVLEGQEQITDIFIVTQDNKTFKALKTKVIDLLGNIIVEEPLKRPMADGFAANVKYFKLGFLDKQAVALDRQFRELLPLLWMKAGAIGRCPSLEGTDIPSMMILPTNHFAVLNKEEDYAVFREQMMDMKEIKTIFFITNSTDAFRLMAEPFPWAHTYQLYKDYLENFTINIDKR